MRCALIRMNDGDTAGVISNVIEIAEPSLVKELCDKATDAETTASETETIAGDLRKKMEGQVEAVSNLLAALVPEEERDAHEKSVNDAIRCLEECLAAFKEQHDIAIKARTAAIAARREADGVTYQPPQGFKPIEIPADRPDVDVGKHWNKEVGFVPPPPPVIDEPSAGGASTIMRRR